MRNHKKGLFGKDGVVNFLKKRYILVASIVLSIIFIFSVNSYLYFQWNKYQDIATNEAIQLAESMETLLHPEHIAELKGSIDDVGTPEYEVVKDSLMRLVEVTDEIRFAYLMAEKEGQ